MPALTHPAPEVIRTGSGITAHLWRHQHPERAPVVLIHGYGSNVLFNWVKTGWLGPLADQGRSLMALDLPGHGTSADVDPSQVRTEDLQADLHDLVTTLSRDETALAPPVVHGYSLGSRIAWEFAATHPDLVSALVLGGSTATDRLQALDAAQARRWAVSGITPEDALTREVVTVAAAMPDQHLVHVVELLLSIAREPFDPGSAVPPVPTLVVAGSRDDIASDADQLAELVRAGGHWARFVTIPGRNHINVLTSRAYKDAVLDALP